MGRPHPCDVIATEVDTQALVLVPISWALARTCLPLVGLASTSQLTGALSGAPLCGKTGVSVPASESEFMGSGE